MTLPAPETIVMVCLELIGAWPSSTGFLLSFINAATGGSAPPTHPSSEKCLLLTYRTTLLSSYEDVITQIFD